MHKAIYIALSGALMKQMEMEVISENISNANTVGFKGRTLSFSDYLINNDPFDERRMTYLADVKIDLRPGFFIKTDNDLDIAIEGRGFISLEEGLYTRRGDLRRTREGYLVTSSGKKVMGERGPIRLPEGKVEIKGDGSIYLDGDPVDRIRIVEFERPEDLIRVGEGLYQSTSGIMPSSGVLQGYLEGSNVEIIKEMVRMIAGLRKFETFQKAIQTLDEAAGKINNDLGRI